MNNPKKYNCWDQPMLTALQEALETCASDDQVRAVILTGKDPYYSSGGNFGNLLLSPSLPSTFYKLLKEDTIRSFDRFIEYPKPILAAVNGPAIGGAVTASALCDTIVASERATFLTPFNKLGLVPEGS